MDRICCSRATVHVLLVNTLVSLSLLAVATSGRLMRVLLPQLATLALLPLLSAGLLSAFVFGASLALVAAILMAIVAPASRLGEAK